MYGPYSPVEIDIQICVQDALKFHRTTPSSFFVSEHEGFHSQLQPANIPEAAVSANSPAPLSLSIYPPPSSSTAEEVPPPS